MTWQDTLSNLGIKWPFFDKSVSPAARLRLEGPCSIGGVFQVAQKLEVGAFSYMHDGQAFALEVGRYCSIGRQLIALQPNHPIDWLSTSPFQYQPHNFLGTNVEQYFGALEAQERPQTPTKTITIGNDVWIGSNVTLLNGISLGNGCIVGAGSVVTKSVPPYAIVGGNPARVLRMRFEEDIIAALQEIKWWDVHPSELQGLDYSDIDNCIVSLQLRIANGAKQLNIGVFEGIKKDFI